MTTQRRAPPATRSTSSSPVAAHELPRSIQRAVRDTMNETCGVVRAEAVLQDGLRRLEEIERREQ